jgi:hypothetical protein
MEQRVQAIAAINQAVEKEGKPEAQYTMGAIVWLEEKNLKLPYQSTKLALKQYGPFKIIKEVSPVAYQLELPMTWGIHDMFHMSLLSPYHKMTQHGPDFPWPPPDLVKGEAKYEVKAIWKHRNFECSRTLQHLIKWQGYPESDNTWEPADNVHTPDLLKSYHRKHIKANGLLARLIIPSQPGSPQSKNPSPQPTIHYLQVPQFQTQSSLSSDSCSLSGAPVLLLQPLLPISQQPKPCQASICPLKALPSATMCPMPPHPLYPPAQSQTSNHYYPAQSQQPSTQSAMTLMQSLYKTYVKDYSKLSDPMKLLIMRWKTILASRYKGWGTRWLNTSGPMTKNQTVTQKTPSSPTSKT